MTQQYRIVEGEGPAHHFEQGEIVTRAAPDMFTEIVERFGATQYTNGIVVQALHPTQVEEVNA